MHASGGPGPALPWPLHPWRPRALGRHTSWWMVASTHPEAALDTGGLAQASAMRAMHLSCALVTAVTGRVALLGPAPSTATSPHLPPGGTSQAAY